MHVWNVWPDPNLPSLSDRNSRQVLTSFKLDRMIEKLHHTPKFTSGNTHNICYWNMDLPPDVYFWMLSIGIKLLQISLICLKGVPSRHKQAVLSAQISRWASSHSMWAFNIVLYFTSSLYGIMALMQFTCQPMRTDAVCWCMAMMQFTCQPMRTDAGC